jgi:hypothetical protein
MSAEEALTNETTAPPVVANDKDDEPAPKRMTDQDDDSSPPSDNTTTILGWTPPEYLEPYRFYIKGAGGVLLAVFLVFPDRLLGWIWNFVWTVVGVALGVGIGGGLALHIFHQLQEWQKRHDQNKEGHDSSVGSSRQNSTRKGGFARGEYSHSSVSSSHLMGGNNGTLFLEDGNSYLSLMAQAGYPIPDRVLRGQVIREDHKFWNINYKFTDDKIPDQQAVRLMADLYPTLPEPVTREMGRFVEHVMRDYISGE